MNHLKKNWHVYAIGIGAFGVGALTVVGDKVATLVFGPTGKRLGS